MAEQVPSQADPDEVPRIARAVVTVLLVLLFVPAVVGFDAWPLTAWRLYSVSREETQSGYRVEAVAADGSSEVLELARLPLGYRNGEWALAGFADKAGARREDVCQAFLTGARERDPDVHGVRIRRVVERLVHDGGEWRTILVEDVLLHTCEGRA